MSASNQVIIACTLNKHPGIRPIKGYARKHLWNEDVSLRASTNERKLPVKLSIHIGNMETFVTPPPCVSQVKIEQ